MLIAHALRLLGFPRDKRKLEAEQRLDGIDWSALDWKFATTWAGERREISPGFDLGADDWRQVIDHESGRQREIEGVDPDYGVKRRLGLWYLEHGGDMRIFAAGEVSNGVWIVFVPEGLGQDKADHNGEPR